MITFTYDNTISFKQLHFSHKRASPSMQRQMSFKHSLLHHKIFNNQIHAEDWLSLHFQQTFNSRNQTVRLFDTSKTKIGKNIVINRLKLINGKIEYEWLNLSWQSYKAKCKSIFKWNLLFRCRINNYCLMCRTSVFLNFTL